MPKAIKTENLLELLALTTESISKEEQQEIKYVIVSIDAGCIYTSKSKPSWFARDQDWAWQTGEEYNEAGVHEYVIDDRYMDLLQMFLPALKSNYKKEVLFKIIRD